jgi:hypothetical protein
MSVVTILLALAPGAIAARLKPAKTLNELVLERRIADLEARNSSLEAELTAVRRVAEDWRDRFMNGGQQHAAAQLNQAAAQLAQYQAQAQAAQLNQAAAQHAAYQAQAQASPYQQGLGNLLGMQQMQNAVGAFEGFCNCVPARHDLLLGGR